MAVRSSEAIWEGDLQNGRGTMRTGSGACEGPFSFVSRFESGQGTNPEELLGAAHAGCFSMALANLLTQAGHPPTRIHTSARVHLERVADGFSIGRIDLSTEAQIPGVDAEAFAALADRAKRECPVSRLFRGAEITLAARLTG